MVTGTFLIYENNTYFTYYIKLRNCNAKPIFGTDKIFRVICIVV